MALILFSAKSAIFLLPPYKSEKLLPPKKNKNYPDTGCVNYKANDSKMIYISIVTKKNNHWSMKSMFLHI